MVIDKYIFLGNGEGWCQASASALYGRKDVLFFNGFPSKKNAYLKFYKRCFSKKIPTFVKKIYMPFIYREALNNINLEKKLKECLIIYDWNQLGGDQQFLNIIRNKYPQTKIIYVFTNICSITGAAKGNYLNKLNDWYDVVFAFDPEDAKKYNFSYSPLIYDADPSYDKLKNESKENLVFYVGQAKDRLSGLLSCYEKLESLGIRTDFHIAKVREEDKRYPDKIIYNKFMTYTECVDAIQHATCLIDVIQGDSTGLTIKTCEAVCYDKKLITTNKHVKEYPFYDPRFIRIVESPEDIDLAFFIENKDVHYSEEGKKYFSADVFLERLDTELKRKRG